MRSQAAVSIQECCLYSPEDLSEVLLRKPCLPVVLLDWDPPVPSTTPRSRHQFVFPTRSGRLLFSDMAAANADVGEQVGDNDQRVVVGLMP